MTIQQYNDIKNMSYKEQLQYFKKINGPVLYKYGNKRNIKPGYYIHHDAENFVAHLCNATVRKKTSPKLQEPEYLTWVDLLQHGFVHLQIGKETKGAFGLEGFANFILPELERYFELGLKHPKRNDAYYDVIKDAGDLYTILKKEYEVLAKELNYKPRCKATTYKATGKRKPARAVKCIETNTIYKNVTEAAAATGANFTCIYQNIYKSANSAGGYTWMFVDPETGEELPARCNKVKVQKVLCVETNTVYTLTEAAEFSGCCAKYLLAHIHGKHPQAGGYHWQLVDPAAKRSRTSGSLNTKKVRCIELDRCFESVLAASKFINCTSPSISACLAGRSKTAGGYHWEEYK